MVSRGEIDGIFCRVRPDGLRPIDALNEATEPVSVPIVSFDDLAAG